MKNILRYAGNGLAVLALTYAIACGVTMLPIDPFWYYIDSVCISLGVENLEQVENIILLITLIFSLVFSCVIVFAVNRLWSYRRTAKSNLP